MLSVFKIESVGMGISYYSEDNYYSKKEQKEHTEWFGKGAEILGLKGNVQFADFKKAITGITRNGILGKTDKKKQAEDLTLSYEKLVSFKQNYEKQLKEMKVSDEALEKINKKFLNLYKEGKKISAAKIEKINKNLCAMINKEPLSLEEKEEIKNGMKEKTVLFKKDPARRPGYDLTFSAPKSFSLAALLHGDTSLTDAHREAVKSALAVVEEEYSLIREMNSETKIRERKTTGNITAALFEHDVSREVDPQLHTHCVLMNFTKTEGDSYKSIFQDGFFYDSKKIGCIYQNELAKRVKGLGYEIDEHDNGTFDLKGYSKEQLDKFSKRAEQLKTLGATNQKERTKFVKYDRKKKQENAERQLLLERWKEEAKIVGIKHPKKQQKREPEQNKEEQNIESVIVDLMRDLTEKDVSFQKKDLETLVLSRKLGLFDYEDIKKNVAAHLEKHAQKLNERGEFVSCEIYEIEQALISIMQRGKETFDPILSEEEARKRTDKIHEASKAAGFIALTEGQREAIEVMLTSQDRIFAWQGVAGAGKSFSLGAAAKIAAEQGLSVKGFAPSAEAAKNLAAEAKLQKAETIASLLLQKKADDIAGHGHGKGIEIWVVDEAGLLGAKDAYNLLKKAEAENARVLLVGDTRQLSAVGAGNPFKQLQQHGIELAELSQGIRQKDALMKDSVALIAAGKQKEGLNRLDKAGKIVEAKTKENIIKNMATDYLSLRGEEVKKSLFISSTNFEKKEITSLVRAGLKARGDLKECASIGVYEAIDRNAHALKYAASYEKGDILFLNKKYRNFTPNTPYKISSVNQSKNTITLETKEGLKEVKATALTGNLFKEKEIEIGVGDRIKWTKNHKASLKDKYGNALSESKRLNGGYLTVKEIDKQAMTAVFESENGLLETAHLKSRHFIDYSYVTTVFSSQGKTCDKVYASVTKIDKENFYVAVSRAKFDCKLYTSEKEQLYKNVEKMGAKQTAEEKLQSVKKEPESIERQEKKQQKLQPQVGEELKAADKITTEEQHERDKKKIMLQWQD